MMGYQIMVVLIVATVMIATVLRARYKALAAERANALDPETQRMREEMKMLRDRIAVLERIATDRGNLLEHEIERLRDQR